MNIRDFPEIWVLQGIRDFLEILSRTASVQAKLPRHPWQGGGMGVEAEGPGAHLCRQMCPGAPRSAFAQANLPRSSPEGICAGKRTGLPAQMHSGALLGRFACTDALTGLCRASSLNPPTPFPRVKFACTDALWCAPGQVCALQVCLRRCVFQTLGEVLSRARRCELPPFSTKPFSTSQPCTARQEHRSVQ